MSIYIILLVSVFLVVLFLLGRWLVHRIEDYPATLFGPLDPPAQSS
jgi:flagellar biosynthesis protein FliQ